MDVNHFGSSTALLSKHILQTIYVSISFYIFTRSQDLPRPSLSPHPRREEATNWSNSDIRTLIKIFKVYSWYLKNFPSYSQSRDHLILIIGILKIVLLFVLPDYLLVFKIM